MDGSIVNKVKKFFSSRNNIIITAAVLVVVLIVVILLSVLLNSGNKNEKNEDLSVYEHVNLLMDEMDLDDKIGQMIVVKESGLKKSDITKKKIGGVVFDSEETKLDSSEDFIEEAEKLQSNADEIPLFYGIKADNEVLTAVNQTVFPSSYALGATRNSTLVNALGKNTANSVLSAGFNWCITDVGTVPFNTTETDTGSCFVQNIYQNNSLVQDYISGIRSVTSPNRLICSVSGFYGKGYLGMDEYSIPDDMREAYLSAYSKVIEAGTKIIIVSDEKVDTVPCAANEKLISVLKDDLSFTGICAADEAALNTVSDDLSASLEASINAGCDMFLLSKENNAVKTIKKLVKDGKILEERINDAVKRIITLKVASGLFEECVGQQTLADERQKTMFELSVVNSPVLLKNSNDTINQLNSAQNIVVLGEAADDLAASCGISANAVERITGGKTIFAALKQTCGERLTHSTSVTDCANADAIIAVIEGNSEPSKNSYISDRDSALLNSLFELNLDKPIILLIVCDRPISISHIFNEIDACAVVWRPGSDCTGIAELLTGNKEFCGSMPCSWQMTSSVLPVYPGKEDNAQFKYGFKLDN